MNNVFENVHSFPGAADSNLLQCVQKKYILNNTMYV